MFVEGMKTATLLNGVLRIEVLYRNAVGEDVTSGELLVPAQRLAALIASLQEVSDQIAGAVEAPAQTH